MCTPSPSRFVPGSGRESRRFAAGSGAKVPQEPTLDDLLVPCHRAESGPRIGVSTKPDSSLQSTHHYFVLWKDPAGASPHDQRALFRRQLFSNRRCRQPETPLRAVCRACSHRACARFGLGVGHQDGWSLYGLGERTTDAAHPHLIVPRLVVGSLRCRLRAMASLGPRCPGQSGRCCNVRSGRH